MVDDGFMPMGDTLHVRVEGDLVVVRTFGLMTVGDIHALLGVYQQLHAAYVHYFALYDCSRGLGLDPAARRALISSSFTLLVPSATVICGASFAVRTLGNMIERALVGLGRVSVGMRFAETEAQARAYLDQERIRIKKEPRISL